MIRAYLAIFVWGLFLIFLGIPVFVAGLVHPSRRVIAWATVFWARIMLGICGVRLTVEGLEHTRGDTPKFYMGNHQSALDIPILIVALNGDVRFMAKKALFRYPIFGWVLWRYGYAPVDRANPRTTLKSLDRMLGRVRRRPTSVAVFPEGTRTYDGVMLPFRQGTMKICQRSGLPAVPFCIDGCYLVNPRERLRAYPGPVRLTFGRPIPADVVAAISPVELHDRVRGAVEQMMGPGDTGSATPAQPSDSEEDQSDRQRDIPAAAHP